MDVGIDKILARTRRALRNVFNGIVIAKTFGTYTSTVRKLPFPLLLLTLRPVEQHEAQPIRASEKGLVDILGLAIEPSAAHWKDGSPAGSTAIFAVNDRQVFAQQIIRQVVGITDRRQNAEIRHNALEFTEPQLRADIEVREDDRLAGAVN